MKIKEQTRKLDAGCTWVRQGDVDAVWIWFSKSISTFFEIGASMKIHKTVNPVAYENTYYLEGEKHLIVVDPGSHWEAILKTNKPT